MDAIRKIEAALPVVLYHHAEADGTFLPSESCVCEDDVYTNNGDDDTIGVPLVRQSDAIAALASKDAEIARLREVVRAEPVAVGQLCEEVFGQIIWHAKPANGSLLYSTPPGGAGGSVGAIDWKTAFEQERAKFQQETLRTSNQAVLLKKWYRRAEDKGCYAEPWPKACADCDLMAETQSLLQMPINATPAAEQGGSSGPKPVYRVHAFSCKNRLGQSGNTEAKSRCAVWCGDQSSCIAALRLIGTAPPSPAQSLDHLAQAVLTLNSAWNRKEPEDVIAGHIDLCRRLAIRHIKLVPAEQVDAKDAGQDYKARYEELLYAVGEKWPGESRHETALKYIQQAAGAVPEGWLDFIEEEAILKVILQWSDSKETDVPQEVGVMMHHIRAILANKPAAGEVK